LKDNAFMTILEKMRLPVYQNIPSGILDEKTEFFAQGVEVYAMHKGCRWDFVNWTEELHVMIEVDMHSHPEAVQSLHELGITNRLEMIWQYVRCRYGAFDRHPDS